MDDLQVRATGSLLALDPLARLEFGVIGLAVLLGLVGLTGLWLTRSARRR